MKPVTIDRATMTSIKRVGLPTTGFPTSPTVGVINGVGRQFGLIGLVSTAIVQNNRSNAVVAIMAARAFDPHAYFQDQLITRLRTNNLGVNMEAAVSDRRDFLKDYPIDPADNATLDVYVSHYGFVAFSDRDDSPYRPAVSLGMRLVSNQDRSILMQDQLTNTGIDAPVGKGAGAVPPSFSSFSDVTANPELGLTSLRLALDYAADSVLSRLV